MQKPLNIKYIYLCFSNDKKMHWYSVIVLGSAGAGFVLISISPILRWAPFYLILLQINFIFKSSSHWSLGNLLILQHTEQVSRIPCLFPITISHMVTRTQPCSAKKWDSIASILHQAHNVAGSLGLTLPCSNLGQGTRCLALFPQYWFSFFLQIANSLG